MIVNGDSIFALSLLSATPQWSVLSERYARGLESVYDPGGHRMLMFGGSGTSEIDLGTSQWRNLASAGETLPRQNASVVWDDQIKRMIVFGGYSTWARNDVAWLQFTPPLDVDDTPQALPEFSARLRPNPASREVTTPRKCREPTPGCRDRSTCPFR